MHKYCLAYRSFWNDEFLLWGSCQYDECVIGGICQWSE